MPFCSQCGAELKEKDKYCPECGAAVAKDTAAAKPRGSKKESSKEPKKKPPKEAKRTKASKSEKKPLEPAPPLKHSGLGIASFIMSLVAWAVGLGFLLFGGYIWAIGFAAALTSEGGKAISLLALVYFIVTGLILLIVPLVGMGLGVAGVRRKNRKRLFGVLGIIFNGGTILGVGVILLIWIV